MSISMIVIIVVVAFSWFGAISAWRVAFLWFNSQAVANGITVLRLRLRQPLYFGSLTYFFAFFLVGSIWYFVAWSERPIILPALFALLNVAQILMLAQPPAAVFLAASGKSAQELYGDLRRQFDGHALSLIRPPGFTVFATYYQRTSKEMWKQTVIQLLKLSPIIVVDARTCSDALLEEVSWLIDLRLLDKVLFVTTERGSDELLSISRERQIDLSNWEHRSVCQFELKAALDKETDRYFRKKMVEEQH